MSNENTNEAMVAEQTTSTENENMVTISAKELSHLNAKVSVLKETENRLNLYAKYLHEAEERLRLIRTALEVINPSEYMSGVDFIKKIAGI